MIFTFELLPRTVAHDYPRTASVKLHHKYSISFDWIWNGMEKNECVQRNSKQLDIISSTDWKTAVSAVYFYFLQTAHSFFMSFFLY